MRQDVALPRSSVDDETFALRLAAAFAALLALTEGLIVLGALVRANDAGLACPDWPLCFGELVPRMDLRVGFEWTHRLVAGTVGVAFTGLAVLALRRPFTRDACTGLLALAALLLAAQVVLGGLTVWELLAFWTVTSHLVTGNAFALTLLWIALSLRDAGRGIAAPERAVHPVTLAVLGVCLLLLAQMVLGGLVASRYAGLACPDFPTCRDGLWLPTFEAGVGLQLLHRINGAALVLGLGAATWIAWRARSPVWSALALASALGITQIGVGAANVLLSLPVEVTGAHSALAAALVLGAGLAVHRSGLLSSRSR